MTPIRTPLIHAGQVFLHEGLNEYIIVTKNDRGQIAYQGDGFRGNLEDYDFLEKFPAVDPADIDDVEVEFLLSYCPPGTEASIGYIGE